MRAALTIALKDLAQRVRDRTVFIIGIIAPLALAFIFNAIFGGGFSDVGQNITLDMGVVNEDDGPLGAAFVDILGEIEADGLISLQTYPDEIAARIAAEEGSVGAVFLLPPGMSDALATGNDTAITVVGNVDAPTTTQIASSVAGQFSLGVQRGTTAAVAGIIAGAVSPADLETVATEAGQGASALQLGAIEAATRQLDSSTYFVAGLSVFFLFFVAGLSVTSMLDERREGTLARLLAAPISPSAIVGGKSLTSVVIGLVAMVILIIASTFLMGADWGEPAGVALLTVAVVLAIVAIMTMVGGFARTAEQAGNLQSIVAVTLAMLGGTFVPITGDGFLADLSLVTPNAWFLRGLGDLTGGGLADVLPAFFVLITIAAVAGLIGLTLVRKAVRV